MSETILSPHIHDDSSHSRHDIDSNPNVPTQNGNYKVISLSAPQSADVESLDAVLQSAESGFSHRSNSFPSETTSVASVIADQINMNTTVIVSEAEPPIQAEESVLCKKKSSSSFDKDLCRVPGLFKLQPLNSEFQTFALFKKTTRKLGSQQGSAATGEGSGSILGSITRVPPVQRKLEDYIKKQTAEYLESIHQQQQKEMEPAPPQEVSVGPENPLMVQGLDVNCPTPRQRPDVDVIYSIDKSALTIKLRDNEDEQPDDEEVEKNFAWALEARSEEEAHTRLLADNSRAEIIAKFVYPKEEEEAGGRGRLPRPESSKPAVLTKSKTGRSAAHVQSVNFSDQKSIFIEILIEKIKVVNQILVDSLIVNREALDVLTFPLSHDFESFGRVKGIFWTLSQTARIIKGLDKQTDTNAIIAFATKEIEGFSSLAEQFMVDSLLLVREIRVGLKRVKKLAGMLEKELRKLFAMAPCSHSSALPIYSTEMDATCITFYEQCQGSSFFDYNQTSIELLWTPTLSYFKGFKERDWYCLQVESPHLQVKILLSLIKLSKRIFLEVKYVLEEEGDTIDTHFNANAAEIQKTLKDLKTAVKTAGPAVTSSTRQQRGSMSVSASGSGAQGMSPPIAELHQQLQIVYDLYNTLDNFQVEFETGFKWIRSVVGDVAQMAALRPEDMDDFRERQNEKGPLSCSIFAKCKQKLDPFLQSEFRFILLRMPLQNDVMFKLMQDVKNKASWNGHAQNILKIMSGAQISQFREKQMQEDSNLSVNEGVSTLQVQRQGQQPSKEDAARTATQERIEYPKSPLTVYNVGHVYIEMKS